MKKFLSTVLFLLIVIVVVLPMLMGLIVKREFRKQILHINTSGVKVTLLQYDAGWFHSSALLKIEENIPTVLQNVQLLNHVLPKHLIYQAKLRIYHGPVALATLEKKHQLFWGRAAINGEILLINPVTGALDNFQGLTNATNVFSILPMLGGIKITLQNNGFKYIDTNQGVLFEMGKTKNYFRLYGRNMSKICGRVNIGKIIIAKKLMKVEVSPVTSTFKYKKENNNFWLGGSRLKISNAQVLYDGKQQADFQKIDWIHRQRINNNKISFSQSLMVDALQIKEENVNKFKLQFSVKNINFPAVLRLKKLLQVNNDVSGEQYKKQFSHQLTTLLLSVKFQLKTLEATTAMGFVKLTGDWVWPETFNSKLVGQRRLLAFFEAGQGKLHVSFPMIKTNVMNTIPMGPGPVMPSGTPPVFSPIGGAVSSIRLMIAAAYEEGYLKRKQDRLVATILFTQGQIKLNRSKTILLTPPAGN